MQVRNSKMYGEKGAPIARILLQLYSSNGNKQLFKVPPILGNWTQISNMHTLEELAQAVELIWKS